MRRTQAHTKALRRQAYLQPIPPGDGNDHFFRQVMFVLGLMVLSSLVMAILETCVR